jgi:hypothetical protein
MLYSGRLTVVKKKMQSPAIFFNGFVLVEKEVDAGRKLPAMESIKLAITTEDP